MTHYRELMLVDAGPDEVFQLVAGVEGWQHLFPHVRDVNPEQPGRWSVVFVWRWIPFATTVAGRFDTSRRMAEFRIGFRFGTRVVVRVAVDESGDDTSSIRIEVDIARVVPLARPLVSAAVCDLSQATLEMVRLLAESDRKSHQFADD